MTNAVQRVAFPCAALLRTAVDRLRRLIRLRSRGAGPDRFRTMLESLPQMVWTASPDGTTYYNRHCHDYLGLTPGQTSDTEWKRRLHPDDRQHCLDHYARCFKTGQPCAIEYRLLRASDQTWRWHLGRGAPTFNAAGGIAGLIGTATDIEDYKQAAASFEERLCQGTTALAGANDELSRTRAKLRSVLDAATQVSIIATDAEGIIQIFNPGAERMLQYRASEMEGVRTLEVIHDSTEWAERSQSLSSGPPLMFEEREWAYVRKDGTRLDVNLAVTAVSGTDDAFQGFLCIATDITARKSLEREFRVNYEKLVAQTRSAEDANLAKSDFLAAMSHEIRTPMNAIVGMADLLRESQLDAGQIQYVDVIRNAGANLLVLINDILDLSKIEAGHLELERIEFHPEKVIDEAVELISLQARAKGLSLTCHSSQDVATALVGDPNRLRQVLINVLGNAVKFTAAGAIEVSVRNHESGRQGEIDFSISDTGIGIPADKLETIFADFTQADASMTRRYGGSGLGLGISRRLVEAMNGRLFVTSTVGKGSTFRFSALFDPAPAGVRTPPVGIEEFMGRRVLVIDGNATDRLILQETISSWGMEGDVFAEPDEAMAGFETVMASERPYALVLLEDSWFGERDGFEAARRISQSAADLPIVMLTTDVRAGDARRRQEAGLAGYAVKPVRRAELLRLVCDVMKPRETQLRETMQRAPAGGAGEHQPGGGGGRLGKSLHILLVEDSRDNRLLVQAYLKGTGHRLDIAEDGQAAVDRFRVEDFELILMDMQMPVMDGLTATRAIRSIERERGAAHVPIVALTANARAQDVEISHQAGCDAHFSKPISRVKLLNIIEELPARRQTRIEIPPGLEELVPEYLAGRKQEVPELLAVLAASDFERLAKMAHNIKGSGASYGFSDLTRIGAALELAAKQNDAGGSGAQLAQLNDYLNHVLVVAPEVREGVEALDDRD